MTKNAMPCFETQSIASRNKQNNHETQDNRRKVLRLLKTQLTIIAKTTNNMNVPPQP